MINLHLTITSWVVVAVVAGVFVVAIAIRDFYEPLRAYMTTKYIVWHRLPINKLASNKREHSERVCVLFLVREKRKGHEEWATRHVKNSI